MRMRFLSRFAGCFLLAAGLFAGAAPLGAQLPRAQFPKVMSNPVNVMNWANGGTFSRTRTVDSSGAGDFVCLGTGTGTYSTTHCALDWLATLKDGSSGHACVASGWAGAGTCRNAANPWLLLVEMGLGSDTDPTDAYASPYTEVRMVLPKYVTLQGMVSGHLPPLGLVTAPSITLSGTSGCLVTLDDGSAVTNMQLFWAGAPTGYLKGACVTNTAATAILTNVSIQMISTDTGTLACASTGIGTGSSACATDGITIDTAGGFYAYSSSVGITSNTLGRAMRMNATSNGASLYGGRWACTASAVACLENTAAGDLSLYSGLRIDAGSLLDLKNGAGTLTVQPGIPYGPVSGTITNKANASPYGTTNPATCSPGQHFVNTGSTKKTCECVAANTWACVTVL